MAATLSLASSNINSQSASVTRFCALLPGFHTVGSQAEGNFQTTFRSGGTASNLYCRISANDRAASTLTLRIDGGNGNQAVTITSSTTGDFEDTSNTDTI